MSEDWANYLFGMASGGFSWIRNHLLMPTEVQLKQIELQQRKEDHRHAEQKLSWENDEKIRKHELQEKYLKLVFNANEADKTGAHEIARQTNQQQHEIQQRNLQLGGQKGLYPCKTYSLYGEYGTLSILNSKSQHSIFSNDIFSGKLNHQDTKQILSVDEGNVPKPSTMTEKQIITGASKDLGAINLYTDSGPNS